MEEEENVNTEKAMSINLLRGFTEPSTHQQTLFWKDNGQLILFQIKEDLSLPLKCTGKSTHLFSYT